VKKYLGSVVPVSDNFFATLNSALFSDGSFVYLPPGVRCTRWSCRLFPHQRGAIPGQFERTLIIADKGSYVSYLELHRAAPRARTSHAPVELVAARRCRDQVFDGPELVPGRCRGPR
jgi:Fe-S cluster assembly protein SufB